MLKHKSFIFFIFILIGFSCSQSSDNFPERREIMWNYNEGQAIDHFDKYKKIYNLNGCIKQTADSGFLFLYMNAEEGINKTFVKKFNSLGQINWQQSYYDSLFHFNAAYDIIEDRDKNFVFVGQQGDNAWVVKLDSQGTVLWDIIFERSANNLFTAISETSAGDYLLAGVSYTDTVDRIMNHSDIWLMHLNSIGDIIWETQYGKSDCDEFVYEILLMPDSSNFIVAGYTASTPMYASDEHFLDALLVKFDSDGKMKKHETFGGNEWDIFYSLTLDDEGYILCAGHTESKSAGIKTNGLADAYVVKVDSDLKLIWTKNYGGSYCDYAHKIIITDKGDYLFLGSTQSDDFDVSFKLFCPPDPWRMFDGWLVKINADGEMVWDVCYGGSENDYGYCLTKSTKDNIIIGLATRSFNGDINNCMRGFWLSQLNINTIDSLYKK